MSSVVVRVLRLQGCASGCAERMALALHLRLNLPARARVRACVGPLGPADERDRDGAACGLGAARAAHKQGGAQDRRDAGAAHRHSSAVSAGLLVRSRRFAYVRTSCVQTAEQTLARAVTQRSLYMLENAVMAAKGANMRVSEGVRARGRL